MKTNLFDKLPLRTLLCSAVALVVWVTGVGPALELTRSSMATNLFSQIFTSHFAHWNTEHLLFDLTAFLILGAYLELSYERSRRWIFSVFLATSAAAVGASVLLFSPSIEAYRGLSGVCSAFFIAAACRLADDAYERRDLLSFGLGVILILGFVTKVLFEFAFSEPLFASSNGEFVSVPVAHLAGALVGSVQFTRNCLIPLKERSLSSLSCFRRNGGLGRSARITRC